MLGASFHVPNGNWYDSSTEMSFFDLRHIFFLSCLCFWYWATWVDYIFWRWFPYGYLYVTEAEGIKKRWQEYTEALYKKDLHDPDNHDGVITHLEPDILECEVKWNLGSIATNKASGSDGIPVELFQILKDDAVKVLQSIWQQIWKTQQWPRTGKIQFSFQSQRKAMPKNAQTAIQLHSSHTLAK